MLGSLTASYGLADVVRGIYVGRRSGILTVRCADRASQLFFEKGSFVFSDTNDESWRIGEILVRRGTITRDDLNHVLTLIAPGKRIGQVLRDLGYLDDDALAEAVAYQITEKIYPAFRWLEGDFDFEEKDKPAPADVAVSMSTANVIMEGVRRIEDVAFIRGALGPPEQVVSLGSNPLLRFQSVFLTPQEGFILSRIDGMLTIDEIGSVSPVAEEVVLRCLYGLKSTGILEIGTAATTAAPEAQDASIASFFADYAGVERFLGAKPVGPAAEKHLDEEERREQEEILELAARIGDLDHYAVLGIEVRADGDTIRKAYYRLAKSYHPDRHHKTHLRQLQDKLERIFVRVNEAYEALKDAKARSQYDAARASGKAVSRDAASKQEAERAQDPAADEARREQLAESAFREGRSFYEQGDIFSAIRAFQSAVRSKPGRAAYHAYLGRALGRNPKWRKEAEEHLLKAVELEPAVAEHYAQVGVLYAAAGLQTRAERYFEEALKWDPSNATASEARTPRGEEGKKLPRR